MLAILLETLPFFAVIGLGYLAGRSGFFPAEATAYLTRFVFYFALSAMVFSFAANLPIREVFDGQFVAAYLIGSFTIYLLATAVAFMRGKLKAAGHTGVILEELRSGSAASAIAGIIAWLNFLRRLSQRLLWPRIRLDISARGRTRRSKKWMSPRSPIRMGRRVRRWRERAPEGISRRGPRR